MWLGQAMSSVSHLFLTLAEVMEQARRPPRHCHTRPSTSSSTRLGTWRRAIALPVANRAIDLHGPLAAYTPQYPFPVRSLSPWATVSASHRPTRTSAAKAAQSAQRLQLQHRRKAQQTRHQHQQAAGYWVRAHKPPAVHHLETPPQKPPRCVHTDTPQSLVWTSRESMRLGRWLRQLGCESFAPKHSELLAADRGLWRLHLQHHD